MEVQCSCVVGWPEATAHAGRKKQRNSEHGWLSCKLLHRTCTTLLSLGLNRNVLQALLAMKTSWLQSGMGPMSSGADHSTALMRCSLQEDV